MCGIFGIVLSASSSFPKSQLKAVTTRLFTLSESRGKDASGLAVIDPAQIAVLKQPERARALMRSSEFHAAFQPFQTRTPDGACAVVGHARMVTNGDKESHANNQPVLKHGMMVLHNGIVVNDAALWSQFPDLTREYEVDTEVILSLIWHFQQAGMAIVDAVSAVFKHLQGANTIALFSSQMDGAILATSNGSLYYAVTDHELLFASEKYILQQLLNFKPLQAFFGGATIHHVAPGEGYAISFANMRPNCFTLGADARSGWTLPVHTRRLVDLPAHEPHPRVKYPPFSIAQRQSNDATVKRVNDAVRSLRRCSKCLLPETFPFIHFDADGVCNFCHAYKPITVRGEDALESLVVPLRRGRGEPDCLVPLSGGRDSSYALHYLKNNLGMNPVAYTYDWGMVTDLARRNISRMCGALGVEHVLVSADIQQKRGNIRKNVTAWLNKPDLGTVPLFMAGDKQFFYYANSLKRMMNLGIVFFSQNDMERTDFKSGFCGIDEHSKKGVYWNLSMRNKAQLALFYGKEFARNPAFINTSMIDTAAGFASYYLLPRDYTLLFQYIRWDEKLFSDTLRGDYDWEVATDTDSTWRIGDGTAPFYNYIYYMMAGFTENDTFRSHQIREGLIRRDDALALVERENQPRYESMQWYCDTVGIDLNAAIASINKAPKRYTL